MMTRTVYTVAFLFFLTGWTGHKDAIEAPRAAGNQTGFSDEEMVNRHNHWRGEVGAPNLRWSDSLATYAQAWADSLAKEGCAVMHRNQDQYGENLKWAGARRSRSGRRFLQRVTPTQVVDEWADERQWYDYDTDRCQTGQECGHYTQVVWAKTWEVGCGRAVCTDKSQVWVCNYSPPGNIVGEKPY